MNQEKIKVWVFSQQPLWQRAVRQAFLDAEDIEVAGEARVTDKLPLTIEVMPPDVAIVDVDSAFDSGLNLANRIKQATPTTGVIVLASNTDDDQLFKVLKTQASAYLGKDISGDGLCDMVRRVARGEHPINESLGRRPKVAAQILHQFNALSQRQEVETLISPLTSREMEIINRMTKGDANKQIAAKLNISEQTIKNHVTSILSKLGANARTEAVVIAIQRGLVSIKQEPRD